MALHIIDRRLAGKNKSVGNRERFVRRFKEQIAEAVRKAVSARDIRHIDQAETVTIPKKDIQEPVFRHGQGGIRDVVLPGNQEHVRGDRIARPPSGGGGSGSQASDSGEGQDDFTFTLTKEEFMDLFFEDLALPRLLRNHIGNTLQYKTRRAGYSHDGTPSNLALVRTMRGALGRRIALTKAAHRELKELEDQLEALLAQDDGTSEAVAELQRQIDALRERIGGVPFLEQLDLRFRNRSKVPVPSSQAVMFCVMDVSGSMDQERKELVSASSFCCTCFSPGITTRSRSSSFAITPRRQRSAKTSSSTPPRAVARWSAARWFCSSRSSGPVTRSMTGISMWPRPAMGTISATTEENATASSPKEYCRWFAITLICR